MKPYSSARDEFKDFHIEDLEKTLDMMVEGYYKGNPTYTGIP